MSDMSFGITEPTPKAFTVGGFFPRKNMKKAAKSRTDMEAERQKKIQQRIQQALKKKKK